ncbi:MAG: hypothetical protein ACO4AI_10245 [Prochlorothrix sp.]
MRDSAAETNGDTSGKAAADQPGINLAGANSAGANLTTALDAAVRFGIDRRQPQPAPAAVVQALIASEQQAKAHRFRHDYGQVLGTWRLTFITGTRKARQRAGIALGAGKFLPAWVKITIGYGQGALPTIGGQPSPTPESDHQGQVLNTVACGGLKLAVGGLVQLHRNRILAFDFTRMTASLGALPLYSGYIRQGADRERRFYQQPVKEQAFFTYFWITEQAIAARGRGGGLALWVREPEET